MKFLKYISLSVALFATACSNDDVVEQGDIQPVAPERELVVGFEGNDSRIQLNEELKTVWTNGDRVAVIYGEAGIEEWEYTGATGERVGHLTPVSTTDNFAGETKTAMVYPYDANCRYDAANGTIGATIAAEQEYLAGSYALNGNVMVGTIGTSTTLRSVCGWFCLNLTGDGEVVSAVKLRGNADEKLVGDVVVTVADATSTLSTAAESSHSEVVLNCGDGVQLSAEVTSFYVALLPQTFSEGVTVEVLCEDGATMTLSTQNIVPINRNTITPMQAVAFKEDVADVEEGDGVSYPTNKQVWYNTYFYDLVTIEGMPFNTAVKSNELRELCVDGECTMISWLTFDDVVTSVSPEAFMNTELYELYLPHSIKTIGAKAFSGGTDFYELHLGSGIKSIEAGAFANCPYLMSIYCRATTPPSLGEGVFMSGGAYVCADIYVPRDAVEAYKSAAGWSEFADYIRGYDYVVADEPAEDDEEEVVRTDFNHRLLLIDHTGVNCGYCPIMTDRLYALANWSNPSYDFKDYYYEVQCHGGAFAKSGVDPAYSDAAKVVDAYQRTTKGLFRGYPALVVNYATGVVDRGSYDWEFVEVNMANAFSAYRKSSGADAGIALKSKTQSNSLTVDIEVTSAKSQQYRIAAWVLENGIYSPNQASAESMRHKTYNHVLRAIGGAYSSSDISGDSLGTIEVGKRATKSFTITLDNSWVTANLEVLVIVSAPNASGVYEVVNTALCAANGERGYEYLE